MSLNSLIGLCCDETCVHNFMCIDEVYQCNEIIYQSQGIKKNIYIIGLVQCFELFAVNFK